MNYTNAEGNVDGRFSDGSPNDGVKGTVVDASFLNAVQNELMSLPVNQGIAPDKEDNSQVKQAVKLYLQRKLTKVSFSYSKADSITERVDIGEIVCPYGAFVDFDVYLNVLSANGDGLFIVGIQGDNETAAQGVIKEIPVPNGGGIQELHRLVRQNTNIETDKFKIWISVSIPSGNANFGVVLKIVGYMDPCESL